MTFTKEQLINQEREEVAFWRERDELIPSQQTDIRLRLAEITLAALTAEPVAYMYKDKLHTDPRFSLQTRFGNWSQEDINEYEITEIPLYAAPPAPVVAKEEPVACLFISDGKMIGAMDYVRQGYWPIINGPLDVYAEPKLRRPGDAIPDEMHWKRVLQENEGMSPSEAMIRAQSWNACRAAMLQGAEPVTDNTNQQLESLSGGNK